jgi:hypothetical protein
VKRYFLTILLGLAVGLYFGMNKYCHSLAYSNMYRPYNLHRPPQGLEYRFDVDLETRWHLLHGCQARMTGEYVKIN